MRLVVSIHQSADKARRLANADNNNLVVQYWSDDHVKLNFRKRSSTEVCAHACVPGELPPVDLTRVTREEADSGVVPLTRLGEDSIGNNKNNPVAMFECHSNAV